MEVEINRNMWNVLRAVQGSLPSDPSNSSISPGTSHPVQRATWSEAVLFANLLSLEQDLTRAYYIDASFQTPVDSTNYQNSVVYCDFDASGFRLPTEGEWEYFARAGTTGPFSLAEPNLNGSTCEICSPGALLALESVAWFCANTGGTTHPVGQKLPNLWGLRDVYGNVREWCWDIYSSNYPEGSATDYQGPASTSGRRVYRGGRWSSAAWRLRSANRPFTFVPGYRVGFRLLRTVN